MILTVKHGVGFKDVCAPIPPMEMETFKVCIFADGKIGRVWMVGAANRHTPCLPPGVVAAEVLVLAAACNLVSEPRCG